MYSSELGRFISRDPIGYADGWNLYAGYFASGWGMDPSGEGLIGSIILPIIFSGKCWDISLTKGKSSVLNLVTTPMRTSWYHFPCKGVIALTVAYKANQEIKLLMPYNNKKSCADPCKCNYFLTLNNPYLGIPGNVRYKSAAGTKKVPPATGPYCKITFDLGINFTGHAKIGLCERE